MVNHDCFAKDQNDDNNPLVYSAKQLRPFYFCDNAKLYAFLIQQHIWR